MGLNGAFLTGDLFNLFVFFEVLLAASYGLLLHGSGRGARAARACTTSSINLAASLLFLIGASLIYGVTGTLNMADLAARIAADRRRATARCSQAGAAILGIAFLVKAGMWPLGFWLPATYAAASAAGRRPCSRILTKVGVYAVLRLYAAPVRDGRRSLRCRFGMAPLRRAWRRSPSAPGVLASRTLSRRRRLQRA